MFTREQRINILKWGSIGLLGLSMLPVLFHGLFFIVLFQYYIPLAIIGYALYFSYIKTRDIELTDEQIRNFLTTKFKRK